jgi:GNAT superfamily N-acetyltransferase
MHAQHLGADVVWARRARLVSEAESARTAKQVARSRTPALAAAPPRPLRLTIRALDATDVDHLRALFERLSPRSRWLRYLAPVRSLTSSALRRLASIDHEIHEALGAFDEGELVGVAHYFRDPKNPARAEISVEVADSHQRRGIGPRLLNQLATLARERGICEFNATALRENVGVLAMVHNSSWPTVVRPQGPEVDIALTLPDAATGTRVALAPCS